MDSSQLALLQADIQAQQQTIDRVFTMLQNRAQNLTPDKIEKLESVAYSSILPSEGQKSGSNLYPARPLVFSPD